MSSHAAALDAADPLAAHRDRFVGAASPLVYLDGNSLGRPLAVTGPRLAAFVEQAWGGRLIRGWDEEWLDLPARIGDEIGRVCLGAAPGQTLVADSTTVLLYKAVRAAVALRPGRTEIVVSADDFPTDRYVAQAIAEERGLVVRRLEVDVEAGVTPEQLREAVGERTAVVLLSHVAYRSAWLADAAALTAIAHDAGALVVWDLSHSGGSVELALNAWDVDLAVGCTYKYLNGGPGAPAYVYAAARLHEELTQPISGWIGHADPFAMGPQFTPAPGIRRMASGTPPILGMLAMQDMLALLDEVGLAAVRAKSVALTSFTIERAEELLAPHGVRLASPRDPARRGGHVTLQHPAMREVVAALWADEERPTIPDYRDPGGLRLGLSPLSTSFGEVEEGLRRTADVLARLA
ncbi:aminotransferase class V-fold PLP-dependent enzyme [Nocardioides sp. TRM66260-LWL]|uniref:kynureninase n=1 Tax=Nocardioides sp. TRM66260-LWL TaxID=2874478 RepID=UPI001CC6ED73|nr:aminotransferase class V-fold PLP-dependent enzyme [Nocardioides sp. TRM66260-LWL]MBZ5733081.1 aminotransferase class V-fold PLP-dependent enzyme [Nocardioides sp. TRM66260-LWL]